MPELAARVVKASRVVAVAQDREAGLAVELARAEERQVVAAAAYSQGYDDGLARAESDGVDASLRGAAALERLVLAALQGHAEITAATSRAVLAAAIDIAEWVLRHELPQDTRSLLARLDEAATSLLPSPSVRVRVSPADASAVQGWATHHRGVEVLVDGDLRPGDAVYDTDAGSVDVSVAAALRIAAEGLGVDPARGPA